MALQAGSAVAEAALWSHAVLLRGAGEGDLHWQVTLIPPALTGKCFSALSSSGERAQDLWRLRYSPRKTATCLPMGCSYLNMRSNFLSVIDEMSIMWLLHQERETVQMQMLPIWWFEPIFAVERITHLESDSWSTVSMKYGIHLTAGRWWWMVVLSTGSSSPGEVQPEETWAWAPRRCGHKHTLMFTHVKRVSPTDQHRLVKHIHEHREDQFSCWVGQGHQWEYIYIPSRIYIPPAVEHRFYLLGSCPCIPEPSLGQTCKGPVWDVLSNEFRFGFPTASLPLCSSGLVEVAIEWAPWMHVRSKARWQGSSGIGLVCVWCTQLHLLIFAILGFCSGFRQCIGFVIEVIVCLNKTLLHYYSKCSYLQKPDLSEVACRRQEIWGVLFWHPGSHSSDPSEYLNYKLETDRRNCNNL